MIIFNIKALIVVAVIYLAILIFIIAQAKPEEEKELSNRILLTLPVIIITCFIITLYSMREVNTKTLINSEVVTNIKEIETKSNNKLEVTTTENTYSICEQNTLKQSDDNVIKTYTTNSGYTSVFFNKENPDVITYELNLDKNNYEKLKRFLKNEKVVNEITL